ncbi:MAG: hypothetical protein ABEJ99_02990 [Candidatus Nanohaloarchaea archaeon]
MAEEPDYEDILDQNVRDVKDSLRDLDSPDWERVLELEKDNKDRKTVKEFVQGHIEESEEAEEGVAPYTDASEEPAEEVAPYVSEDTEGGLLGSLTNLQVASGGVVLGVVIGLLVGLVAFQSGPQVGPNQVQNQVQQLFTASGVPAQNIDFVQTIQKHGMYYMQVNVTSTGNQSQTSSRQFYVSSDGELLFPVVKSSFIQTPINVQDTLQRIQAQKRQQMNQAGSQNSTQ